MRFWNVYHESLESLAARPIDVRPCHWHLQARFNNEAQARLCAQTICSSNRVHAKVTDRTGTTFFRGRDVTPV